MNSVQQIKAANQEYVIFAIDEDKSKDDFDAFLKLNAVPVSECIGAYTYTEGELAGTQVVEPSYLIPEKFMFMIANAGWTDRQESILHLGPLETGSRSATLHFGDQNTLPLGSFRECSVETALSSDAWTYNKATGRFYITD